MGIDDITDQTCEPKNTDRLNFTNIYGLVDGGIYTISNNTLKPNQLTGTVEFFGSLSRWVGYFFIHPSAISDHDKWVLHKKADTTNTWYIQNVHMAGESGGESFSYLQWPDIFLSGKGDRSEWILSGSVTDNRSYLIIAPPIKDNNPYMLVPDGSIQIDAAGLAYYETLLMRDDSTQNKVNPQLTMIRQ